MLAPTSRQDLARTRGGVAPARRRLDRTQQLRGQRSRTAAGRHRAVVAVRSATPCTLTGCRLRHSYGLTTGRCAPTFAHPLTA